MVNTSQKVASGDPAAFGDRILRRRYRLTNSLVTFTEKRVLDFGCGNGAQTVLFADRDCEIVAVDIHQSGLDRLSEYNAENGIRNILPVLYAGQELPFDDNYFDLVISYEVLEHVQNEDLALREIQRVLKPGGEVVFSVPNRAWVFETHGANLPLLPWNRVPFFSWLPKTLHSRWAKARIYNKTQLAALFERHGFKTLQIQYITAPMDVVNNPRLKHFLTKYIFRGDTTNIPFLSTAILFHGRNEQ